MHTVVTMTDRLYFPYGTHLMATRGRVHARFACYTPDASEAQRKLLAEDDIGVCAADAEDWAEQMQYMKLQYLARQSLGGEATFVDWDTFFSRDWYDEVFGYDFDLGITYNPAMCKTRCFRAWANGGVIFARGEGWFPVLQRMIMSGGADCPEYSEAFDQLESTDRPPHKRWSRQKRRWWVDQVALSALVRIGIERRGALTGGKGEFMHEGLRVRLFTCDIYNHLNALPHQSGGAYAIGHLKQIGRAQGAGTCSA